MCCRWIIPVALLVPALAFAADIPIEDLDNFGPPCDLDVNELTPGGDRLLSWSAVSGASFYRVGRIDCDETLVTLAETTSTSYTDDNYDANECYEYVMVAYDSSSEKICAAHVEDFGDCPCQ